MSSRDKGRISQYQYGLEKLYQTIWDRPNKVLSNGNALQGMDRFIRKGIAFTKPIPKANRYLTKALGILKKERQYLGSRGAMQDRKSRARRDTVGKGLALALGRAYSEINNAWGKM